MSGQKRLWRRQFDIGCCRDSYSRLLGGFEHAPPYSVYGRLVVPSRFRYPSIAVRSVLYAHWQENPNLLLPTERWEALLPTGKEDNRDLLLQVERTVI
jgi:hypothetical protein